MMSFANEKLSVTVAIPAYNEAELLPSCLNSLKKQDYAHRFEVIVCDNCSTDNTAAVAKQWGATVVTELRKGSRFAYDTAMRHAQADLILVTNADIVLPENWISSIVAAYQENPELVGVGTKVRFQDVPKYVQFFLSLSEKLNPTPTAMWGVSLSCKRWAYEALGGFDHGANTNEDGIFSLLLMQLGEVKKLPEPIVYMNGRRFNRGLLTSIREWFSGIGLNSIYIQLSYFLTGKIRSLNKDFQDVRESQNSTDESK